MSSAVDESKAGTGNEVLDGHGDENLVRLRMARDTGSEVYRDSQHLVTHHFAFAGVQARPNRDSQVSDRVTDRTRTADTPARPVVSLRLCKRG